MRSVLRRSFALVAMLAIGRGATAHVQILTPEEKLSRFEDELRKGGASACQALGSQKHTFGDVRVTLKKGPLSESSISIQPEADLDPEVVACVDRAVREQARRELASDGIVHATSTEFLIGEPESVLPPLEQLLDDWRRAGAKPSARRALQRGLTRGISVSDQGCLRFPARLWVERGLGRWLRQAGPAIIHGAFAEGVMVFAGLGPVRPVGGAGFTADHHWSAGVFIDDDTVLLLWSASTYGRGVTPSELCLVPLATHTRAELSSRLDLYSSCLAGDLRQRFTRPRITFPADRRYRAVATGQGPHTCAVDVDGHATCCGRRLPAPPTHAFTVVTPGWNHDCGLRADGALTCWGAQPPVPAPVRGPFAALASDQQATCAVAKADRSLTCWGIGAGVNRDIERSVGAVARVAVDDRGICALRPSGELLCWGQYRPPPVSVPGRFKAFDMHAGYACGVEAGEGKAKGTLTCWYRQPLTKNQEGRSQPVQGGGYVDVAVSYERGCGLDGGGGLHCWPSEVRRSFEGRFQSVSGGSHICAVTTEGRVVCEDREYY